MLALCFGTLYLDNFLDNYLCKHKAIIIDFFPVHIDLRGIWLWLTWCSNRTFIRHYLPGMRMDYFSKYCQLIKWIIIFSKSISMDYANGISSRFTIMFLSPCSNYLNFYKLETSFKLGYPFWVCLWTSVCLLNTANLWVYRWKKNKKSFSHEPVCLVSANYSISLFTFFFFFPDSTVFWFIGFDRFLKSMGREKL